MSQVFKSIRLLMGLFIVIFLAQGCARNLPAVRQFSQATIASSNSFDQVVDDLPKSCIRRAEFTLEEDKYQVQPPSYEVEYTDEYKERLKACDELKQSIVGIVEAQNVLQSYAEALGKLASDDVVTFSTETKALRDSLKKVDINGDKPFDDAKVAATLKLAEFLLKVVANGYRQKELKETIKIGNEYLGELIAGLKEFVLIYTKVLENEENTIASYRNNFLKIELIDLDKQLNSLERKGRKFAALTNLLEYRRNQLQEELLETKGFIGSVEDKKNAAMDYITILDNISSTHKKLYESRSDLGSLALIQSIQEYAQKLVPLINDIREAFNE